MTAIFQDGHHWITNMPYILRELTYFHVFGVKFYVFDHVLANSPVIYNWKYCKSKIAATEWLILHRNWELINFNDLAVKIYGFDHAETNSPVIYTFIERIVYFRHSKYQKSDCQCTAMAQWWHQCCETQYGVQCQLIIFARHVAVISGPKCYLISHISVR